MRQPSIFTALYLFSAFSLLVTGLILFAATASAQEWVIFGAAVCGLVLVGWGVWRLRADRARR
ncbi:MAG: hypothetical protein ACYDHT_05425 [Solirubrobacteraceae bacterium]